MKTTRTFQLFVSLLAAVGFVAVGCLAGNGQPPILFAQKAALAASIPTPTPTAEPTGSAPLSASQSDTMTIEFVDAAGLDIAERRIIDVYDRVAPSVVNITTQVLRRSFFFDVVPEEGAGSGFILDKEGRILTNYHVINGAQRIDVTINDSLVLPANVIGADARNDIALLQVQAAPELLTPVVFGESATLKVGQRAIAIGNPFGQFDRTLTTGVISALNRTIQGQDGRTITGIIQTDASINRGNSGGPLLDSSGRVIGINSAIFSPTGVSAGVGFAVPIDTVKRLLADLLELGHYRHPWLGVRYGYTLSPSLADLLELPLKKGVLLVQLYRGSPLADADIRGAQQEKIIGNQQVYVGGDIITAIDGKAVASTDELDILLENNYRVGDSVQVTLWRDSGSFDVTVELVEEPN